MDVRTGFPYRLVKLDKEERVVDVNKPQLLKGFNEVTKGNGYYKARFSTAKAKRIEENRQKRYRTNGYTVISRGNYSIAFNQDVLGSMLTGSMSLINNMFGK